MTQIVVTISVSHVDEDAAMMWLRWASFLSRLPNGNLSDRWLVVTCTQRVREGWWQEACGLFRDNPRFFNVHVHRLGDEDERGYPGSASHLFVRTMQVVEQKFWDAPKLYVEPDCIPVVPNWLHCIDADYKSKGAKFLGQLIPSTAAAINDFGFPALHLTGNAVYPPDVFRVAPSLTSILRGFCDHRCPWGEKGWAWDLWSAHEIVPEAAESSAIHQIWKSDPWDIDNLNRIPPGCVLLHQSKDCSLITSIAERHYPEFLPTLPNPKRLFLLQSRDSVLQIGSRKIKFIQCARDSGGRLFSIRAPIHKSEEMLLLSRCGRGGLSEIEENEYNSLKIQSQNMR
jgi:hypothetical protein